MFLQMNVMTKYYSDKKNLTVVPLLIRFKPIQDMKISAHGYCRNFVKLPSHSHNSINLGLYFIFTSKNNRSSTLYRSPFHNFKETSPGYLLPLQPQNGLSLFCIETKVRRLQLSHILSTL